MNINKAQKVIGTKRSLSFSRWMNEGKHPDEWPGHQEPLVGVVPVDVEAAILFHVQPLRDEIAALKRREAGVYSVREVLDADLGGEA